MKEINRKSDVGESLCAALIRCDVRSRKEPGKEHSKRREREFKSPGRGQEVTLLLELQGP